MTIIVAEIDILFFEDAPAAGAERAGLCDRVHDLVVEVLERRRQARQVSSA